MANPYFNRPFPAYFFGWTPLKVAHYFTFWALCNDCDVDEEGLIRTERKFLVKHVGKYIDKDSLTITGLVKTLEDLGAIQIVKAIPSQRCSNNVDGYIIRIAEEIWEMEPVNEAPRRIRKPRPYDSEARKAKYYARKAAGLSV